MHAPKSSLTNSQVCVYACITCRSRQILILSVRDMKVGLGIAILLGKTKVDGIDLITTFSNTHQEVVRLDVTMNEIFRMDIFNAGYL
jgi:hypothetical protein